MGLSILAVAVQALSGAQIVAQIGTEASGQYFDPAAQWPYGELNCAHGYRRFDPLTQKRVYTVGVHAPSGIEVAWREFNLTFETYLDETVGKRWKPPLHFKMLPTVDPLKDWVDNEADVDFMYSDTGLYSCVGVEIGGQPLGTTISHLSARGREFNLDVFGGSIIVRADNYEINSIADVKDKIIGAQSISDFSGAQVQFYVLYQNGLDYVMDPKQVVFTENQEEIVKGVLDGRWDVGFVRTGQIERTMDENEEYLDSDLFKVLEPRIYIMDTGELFPFLHSSPVFPEWPLYAKEDVDRMVSEEIQLALINFEYHKTTGDRMHTCKHDICEAQLGYEYDPEACLNLAATAICDTAPPVFFDPNARCDTTRELAEIAYQAGIAGRHNGFRPARSHFSLRTMQQSAGFLVEDDQGNWKCSRAETLYDGIICPEGHYKVKHSEFLNQCDHLGLPCPDGYTCYCKPCIKAFEVEVMQWDRGGDSLGGNTTFFKRVSGCDKMSLCGTVEQTKHVTFRAYDNRERDNADFKALIHVGQESRELEVTSVEDVPYAYEFTFTDNDLGVGILEIFVDDTQIPESPFRVEIVSRNCEVDYPGQGKTATDTGECACSSGSIQIGGECMSSGIVAAIVSSVVFLIALQIGYCYLGYRRAKSDEMWKVCVEELHFSQPPEIIGQGSFGVVLLAEYRGTKVAIKRILPQGKGGGSKAGGSRLGGSVDGGKSTEMHEHASTGSVDIESQDTPPKPGTKILKGGTVGTSSLKGTHSLDGGMNSRGSLASKSCSMDGSELDFLGGLSYGGPKSKWAEWFPWVFQDRETRYNASILGSASGASNTSRSALARVCPWFDENTRRQNEFMVEMRLLSRLRHPCITTVMGAVFTRGCEPMMVMEFMDNGSLYDLLRNETLFTGGEIIIQIVRDVAQGLRFLHASKPPILHGDMKAKNILIDSRFRAKVADFGLATKTTNRLSGTPFWMAPEYLRGKCEYNSTCDVYAFGIILYEIYGRKNPYEGENPRQVLRKVCDPRVNKRPPVPDTCPPKMVDIMCKCWSQDPFFRPQAKDLDILFTDMNPQDAEPIVDGTRVRTERATGDMLYQVFPKKVADLLKAGQKVEPETHDCVTIFFSDIVHFTDISRTFSPGKVCDMLDRLYVAFDNLASKHQLFKVETIGDAWMGVTNLEGNQEDTHAKHVAEFAVDAIMAAGNTLIDTENPARGYVRIRVGFHSGPVVSNVIGSLNPRYGLFGDTVNTASRMESNSFSGKIHCSEAAAEILKVQAPLMPLHKRGKLAVKGKGTMTTYWVGEGLIKEHMNGSFSKLSDHPTVGFAEEE